MASIKHLEAGTAPWQKPWHPGKALAVPHNPQTGTVYKGINRANLVLTMIAEGYSDPRWLTVKQANDMGLRIKKGSRSEAVVYYQFTKEQERLDDDGKPEMETVFYEISWLVRQPQSKRHARLAKHNTPAFTLLICALKIKLFNAGQSAEKRGFRLTDAALLRVTLAADVQHPCGCL